jgi:hypothetical protein
VVDSVRLGSTGSGDGGPYRLVRGAARERRRRARRTVGGERGVPVGRVALAHFDVATDRWIAPAGTYTVMAGDSSRNLPSTKTLTLSQALVSPT